MGTGILAWALLLVGNPAEADVVHFPIRGFQIPVKIDPSRRADVHELILYLSRDQGRTWETAMRLAPDKPGFDFMASADGMHYFSIAVVDKKGVQEPADVYKAPVGQKILIDTAKPTVRVISAERIGEEIQLGWEAKDDRPNWSTMKVEYKVGAAPTGQWTPLPVAQPGERGNVRFRPGMPGDVTVRVSMLDMAENVGVEERVVSAAPVTTVSAAAPIPVAPPPLPSPVMPPPPPPLLARAEVAPPPPPSFATMTPPPAPAYAPPPAPAMSAKGALPEVQIVNKKDARIGFDVSRFGPSGLGSVEVYVTTDEGNTWNEWKMSGGVQLPMPGEMRGNVPVSGSISVPLPRDGQIYGLYLIVRSRAGLGKPKPMPGDAPHIRLELDTTPPEAVLHMPKPDPTRSEIMVFSWKADDRNLAQNPITLQWSERPDGPWEFVGESQLPNTGQYAWQVPDRIPPKVFLQLTVRDRAGNASQARTPEPIPLDTRVPETTGVRLIQK